MDEKDLQKWELELLSKEAELKQAQLHLDKSRKVSIAVILSILAIIISGLQAWVSIEQRKVSEAQTIQQYIPHLIKEDTREMALKSLRKYFDDEFIIELSKNYNSRRTLVELAKSEKKEVSKKAKEALDSINITRNLLISQVFSDTKAERIQSSNELINNWSKDPLLIPSLITYSEEKFKNKDGVYNAAVILNQLEKKQLKANAKVVVPFVEKVNKTDREKTKKMISGLLESSK